MPTCNRGVFSSRVPQELLAIIVWPRRWRGRWRWRRRWRSMMALTDSFGEKIRVPMCCRVPVTALRLQGSLLDIGGHGAQPTREDGRKTGEGATTSGPRREAGVCGRWAVGGGPVWLLLPWTASDQVGMSRVPTGSPRSYILSARHANTCTK